MILFVIFFLIIWKFLLTLLLIVIVSGIPLYVFYEIQDDYVINKVEIESDEVIVTFIYSEEVEARDIQTTATSQLELYDSKNTILDLVEPISINITEEKNNII